MVYHNSRCHCVVTYLLNIASLHAQRLLFFEENNIRRLTHSKIIIHCSIRKINWKYDLSDFTEDLVYLLRQKYGNSYPNML